MTGALASASIGHLRSFAELLDRVRAADAKLAIKAGEHEYDGARYAWLSVVWPTPIGADGLPSKHVPSRVLIEESHDIDICAAAILDRWPS